MPRQNELRDATGFRQEPVLEITGGLRANRISDRADSLKTVFLKSGEDSLRARKGINKSRIAFATIRRFSVHPDDPATLTEVGALLPAPSLLRSHSMHDSINREITARGILSIGSRATSFQGDIRCKLKASCQRRSVNGKQRLLQNGWNFRPQAERKSRRSMSKPRRSGASRELMTALKAATQKGSTEDIYRLRVGAREGDHFRDFSASQREGRLFSVWKTASSLYSR